MSPQETATPRYALLPGDPGRVQRLLAHLDDAGPISGQAPFLEGVGSIDGTAVLVAATGMGGPSVVVSVERLASRGVDTFLRVGGAGPVAEKVQHDDIVVGTGSVRCEGASAAALRPSWPCVTHPSVVDAVMSAARAQSGRVLCGVLHTKDSFFGEVDPASSPVEAQLRAEWDAWQRLGVLASEMEASVLFALASLRGWRAGAVVKVNAIGDPTGAAWTDDEDLCRLAVAGLAQLIARDRE